MNLVLKCCTLLLTVSIVCAPVWATDSIDPDSIDPDPIDKDYTVQVGAYQSAYRARVVRSIVEKLAPAQIVVLQPKKGAELYRVIVGSFKTKKDADTFIEKNTFRSLFPDVFVSELPASAKKQGRSIAGAKGSEELIDPYHLEVNLFCEKDRKLGQYQAEFKPEPGENMAGLGVDINWACYKRSPASLTELELASRPSFYSLSPLTTFGTLSGENSTGSFSRFGFGYGIEAGVFRNFGAVGPFLNYRFLRQRFSAENILDFRWRHSVSAGIHLPVAERLVLEPSLGMSTQDFLLSSTYSSKLLPDLSLKGIVTLLKYKPGANLDLLLGFSYLFPSTSETLSVNHGLKGSVGLRSRLYSGETIGSDWSAEYSLQKRDGTGLEQNESAFKLGITFLLLK